MLLMWVGLSRLFLHQYQTKSSTSSGKRLLYTSPELFELSNMSSRGVCSVSYSLFSVKFDEDIASFGGRDIHAYSEWKSKQNLMNSISIEYAT